MCFTCCDNEQPNMSNQFTQQQVKFEFIDEFRFYDLLKKTIYCTEHWLWWRIDNYSRIDPILRIRWRINDGDRIPAIKWLWRSFRWWFHDRGRIDPIIRLRRWFHDRSWIYAIIRLWRRLDDRSWIYAIIQLRRRLHNCGRVPAILWIRRRLHNYSWIVPIIQLRRWFHDRGGVATLIQLRWRVNDCGWKSPIVMCR